MRKYLTFILLFTSILGFGQRPMTQYYNWKKGAIFGDTVVVENMGNSAQWDSAYSVIQGDVTQLVSLSDVMANGSTYSGDSILNVPLIRIEGGTGDLDGNGSIGTSDLEALNLALIDLNNGLSVDPDTVTILDANANGVLDLHDKYIIAQTLGMTVGASNYQTARGKAKNRYQLQFGMDQSDSSPWYFSSENIRANNYLTLGDGIVNTVLQNEITPGFFLKTTLSVNGFGAPGVLDMSTYDTIHLKTSNSSQWEGAYDYSQIGHLPLTGGTLSGDLQVENSNQPTLEIENLLDGNWDEGDTIASVDFLTADMSSTGPGSLASIQVVHDRNGSATGQSVPTGTLHFGVSTATNDRSPFTAMRLMGISGDLHLSKGDVYLEDSGGQFITTTSNSSEWESAYAYAQIGHLPLSGGTLSGNVVYSPADFLFSSNTSDGADNTKLTISGGGSADESRGGYISVTGNESINAGNVIIRAGEGVTRIDRDRDTVFIAGSSYYSGGGDDGGAFTGDYSLWIGDEAGFGIDQIGTYPVNTGVGYGVFKNSKLAFATALGAGAARDIGDMYTGSYTLTPSSAQSGLVAVGSSAFRDVNWINSSTAVGSDAGRYFDNIYRSTFVGTKSGSTSTSGTTRVAKRAIGIGEFSLYGGTLEHDLVDVIAVGMESGLYADVQHSILLGSYQGYQTEGNGGLSGRNIIAIGHMIDGEDPIAWPSDVDSVITIGNGVTPQAAKTINFPDWDLYLGDRNITSEFMQTISTNLNFPSIAAGSAEKLTLAYSGAADGDMVVMGKPAAVMIEGLVYQVYVVAPDVIEVSVQNTTGASIDPPAGDFNFKVLR